MSELGGLEWGNKNFWEEVSYQLETGQLCSWPWEDVFIGYVSNSECDDNEQEALEDYWEDEYWEDGFSSLVISEGSIIDDEDFLKSYDLFETEPEYPPLPPSNDEYEQVCSFEHLGFNAEAYSLTYMEDGKEEGDHSSDASIRRKSLEDGGRKSLECGGRPRGLYGCHQIGLQLRGILPLLRISYNWVLLYLLILWGRRGVRLQGDRSLPKPRPLPKPILWPLVPYCNCSPLSSKFSKLASAPKLFN